MPEVKKVRKKVVEVEAVEYDGSDEAGAFIHDWAKNSDPKGDIVPYREKLSIHTLEGTMTGSPGDFIIRGVAGEFYACKPDIFKQTYETVEEGDDGDISDDTEIKVHRVER